jgi:bacterioferritin-associated ferredoxin
MSKCWTCGKEVADDEVHAFAGWSFYLEYCADCCPGMVDGSGCGKCDEDANQFIQAVTKSLQDRGIIEVIA